MSTVEDAKASVDPRLIRWGGYGLTVVGAIAALVGGVMPGMLSCAAALILALAPIGIAAAWPQLFEVTSRGQRGLNPLVGLPAVFLLIGSLTSNLLDERPAWIAAFVVGAALGLAIWLAAQQANLSSPIWAIIVVAIIGGVYGYGAFALADARFDPSPGTSYPVAVTSKYTSQSRSSTDYHLQLPAWGPRKAPSEVTVTDTIYNALQPGDPVCMILHPGALGDAWYDVSLCSAAGGVLKDVAFEPSAVSPLGRSMRRAGNLLITISAITPAASVFIMGQVVIAQAGTGAVMCFVLTALLGLATAFVYAELSSAFPLTGGEYSMIGRTMGPSWGFMALGLNLFGGATGQAVTALGLADYLSVVAPGIPALPVALAATVGTTLVTLLNVRLNAKITGMFLIVELAALGVMTAVGVAHPHRSIVEAALHPVMLGAHGLVATPWAVIGLASAGAIYAYNGYGGAVYFGEEMFEARTKIAWVVFVSLAVAVVAEFAPILAMAVGVGDLKSVLAAKAPMPAFLAAAGGDVLAKAVSLGVAFAIVNAMIAIGLINARQLYCSGRDGVWPGPVNGWVAAVHPRFQSPWISALVMGAATLGCCFLPLDMLVMVTGAGLVVVYAGVAVAAMAGRRNGTTDVGHYRMPLYPLWPVLSLVALAGVTVADILDPVVGRPSLVANIVVMALSAAYYLVYLRRRGGWVLRGADGAPLDGAGPEGLATDAAASISSAL